MNFDPQNILVIHFGQMGDVILSLPALQAIRQRFPGAKITALVGKSSAMIVPLAGVFDEEISVDRVALRDGNKLISISKIRQLVKDIRRRKFDFVIDLHSLSETNLLGFLSGAKYRLYANRENRSLDYLAKFPEKPPLEEKSKHIAERYLDVLKPLGIENVSRFTQIKPFAEDVAEIEKLFSDLNITGKQLIGMFLGAGHPSRRWHVAKFAELARRFSNDENRRVLVFLGPEELDLLDEVKRIFPPNAVILDNLKLLPLLAATAVLRILISNDTGPMHLAAVAGAPVVLILDKRAPDIFLPLSKELRVVNSSEIDKISVEEVFKAASGFLDNELTEN